MIRAGELRECVQLFRVSTTNDDTVGELVETPTCYATKRAKVTPSESQESEIAAGQQARTSYDLTMRLFDTLKHTDRIEYRGETLEIASVVHDRVERLTKLKCRAIEVDEMWPDEEDDRPQLSGAGSTTTWDKAYDGTAIAPAIVVSDDDLIASATVWISSGGLVGDRIIKSVADGSTWTENGITWTWTAGTFTLAGVGAAAASVYQSQLRALKYDYNNGWGNFTPGNRVVSFKVNDGANDSNTVTQTVSATYFTGSLGSWTWKGVYSSGAVPSGQMFYDGGSSPFTSPINLASSNQLKRFNAIQVGATIQFGGGINGVVSLIEDALPLYVVINSSNDPNVGSLTENSSATLTVVAP